MSTCRSCGAPIMWATTTHGRSMPVDRDPVPDGNVVLTYPSPGAALALVIDPDQLLLDDPPRYLSHFATCPNADQHRRQPTCNCYTPENLEALASACLRHSRKERTT